MATNHEVGSSILSGRTTFPFQPGILEIPRVARDFACGLPLRSRPQDGSSSIHSGRTILPTGRRSRTKFLSFVPLVSIGLNQTAHMETLIEERHRLLLCTLVRRFLSPGKTDGGGKADGE
jgi:hypothetical protein